MKAGNLDYLKPLTGDKFAAEMARFALPILVRQARSGQSMTYSALAAELSIPFDLSTKFPLEAIGKALEQLSKLQSGKPIPPLQYLVVKAGTDVPGDGFNAYHPGYSGLSRQEKRAVTAHLHADIVHYPHWNDVLAKLNLVPLAASGFAAEITKARSRCGGSEGPEHKSLKDYIASQPKLFGLPANTAGKTEQLLPSGDRPDVTFEGKHSVVLIEVKAASCPEDELTRGVFQAVKYRAVIEASDIAEPQERFRRVILVLGGVLSNRHRALANLLGVEVMEEVQIPVSLATLETHATQG